MPPSTNLRYLLVVRLIRWIRAWAVAAALAVVCVLTLSDSVMGPLRRVGRLGLRVIRRAESDSGFDLVSRPDLPVQSDTIGHFLAWAAIGLVAAGLARGARARVQLFLGLLVFSAFLEVAQEYLSWSRTPELTDLAANGAGLIVGFAIHAVLAGILGPVITAMAGRTGGGRRGVVGPTATES